MPWLQNISDPGPKCSFALTSCCRSVSHPCHILVLVSLGSTLPHVGWHWLPLPWRAAPRWGCFIRHSPIPQVVRIWDWLSAHLMLISPSLSLIKSYFRSKSHSSRHVSSTSAVFAEGEHFCEGQLERLPHKTMAVFSPLTPPREACGNSSSIVFLGAG